MIKCIPKGSEGLNQVLYISGRRNFRRKEESKGLISGDMTGVGGTARKPAELEWSKPGENGKG